LLAGLAGEIQTLEPPRGKWTNAGYVSGTKRSVAWRVLDAQHFGVAQRRRRVFVVASAGNICASEILFEREGLRRDIAPSRKKKEKIASSVAHSINAKNTAERMTFDFQSASSYGENQIAATLSARDFKSAKDLVVENRTVRRLTPIEHERLQGFSDNYTNIPWGKSSDSLRYKALGNSMAVPCMRWIGDRISQASRVSAGTSMKKKKHQTKYG
jgi:site-specific DNA-cytosine methylase